MFKEKESKLKELGADITTREIAQQPELWDEAYANFQEKKSEVDEFLTRIRDKHDFVRVIFTGAGTSAFVGETIAPHLNAVNDNKEIEFLSIATTDILGTPEKYLQADIPTILVSFARSGNSPESVATVQIARETINDFYQITITCATEGKLAVHAQGDADNLLILQPERSNDAGFAMTGSYTCMTLTALLVFDRSVDQGSFLPKLVEMGNSVVEREEEIQEVVNDDSKRVIYLGSGGFFGLARESQLKILELTAGKVATMYETPLGFRHGPKSFIDDETTVIVFVSQDSYTRQYDVDLLNEVYHDHIAKNTIALTTEKLPDVEFDQFVYEGTAGIPDVYLALPYVMFAQTFALFTSVKVGNKPDTPSPTGTVNRVVQGVIIHEYDA